MMEQPKALGEAVFANRTGIVIGALIGVMSGGFIGLIVGAAVGFFSQRALKGIHVGALSPQKAFFEATFAVMGRIAKADGRVTENEIRYAEGVMTRMNLSGAKRQEAIELFKRGKEPGFELTSVVVPLARLIRMRSDLKQMFVEILLQAAYADGQVSQEELLVVQEVCSLLQLSYQELEQILQRSRAEQAFHQQGFQEGPQGQGGYQGHGAFDQAFQRRNNARLLEQAYGVLGVGSEAGDSEVKRAYRRLMNQHHPDKLIAKGLPEEMMQLAKEKTQEIQAAYDRVREARKGA